MLKRKRIQGLVAATLSLLDEKGKIKHDLIDRLVGAFLLFFSNWGVLPLSCFCLRSPFQF